MRGVFATKNGFLNWMPVWNFEKSIHQTTSWYTEAIEFKKVASENQLSYYFDDAKKLKRAWIE